MRIAKWIGAASLLLASGAARAVPGDLPGRDDLVYPQDEVLNAEPRRVDVAVTDAGPQPREIEARRNERILLVVTRETDRICRTDLLIPAFGVRAPLPKGKPVAISLVAWSRGQFELVCPVEDAVGGLEVR
jgi:plastocyanin domain-containing protein